MAVIHQRLEITAIYQSIRGLPRNKATGHASPEPQILTAVAEMLLINNSAVSTAPQTTRGQYRGPGDLHAPISCFFFFPSPPSEGADVFQGRDLLNDLSRTSCHL